MSSIKAVIIDDDSSFAAMLRGLLGKWAADNNAAIVVSHYDALPNPSEILGADLLFLDIELPDGNGLSFAHKLRGENAEIPIIFVTSHKELAVRGYEVEAFGYLVKDTSLPLKLRECMKRLMPRLDRRRRQCYVLKSTSGYISIPFKDILYFEVFNHDLHIHTDAEMYVEHRSLDSAVGMLPEYFSRISRFCVVNMERVSVVSSDIVTLNDGTKLKLTRKFIKDVVDAYIRFNT